MLYWVSNCFIYPFIMKTYTVYLRDGDDPLIEAIYLSEGFSLSAAIFNILWMFCNRIWLHTILFTVLSICILQLQQFHIITPLTGCISFLTLWIYVGFNGRDYLRYKLEKDGYKMKDILVANSDEEAEFLFISKHMQNLGADNLI